MGKIISRCVPQRRINVLIEYLCKFEKEIKMYFRCKSCDLMVQFEKNGGQKSCETIPLSQCDAHLSLYITFILIIETKLWYFYGSKHKLAP